MYRAVLLLESQRDLDRFIWRNDLSKDLQDYRMNTLTFGVSASPFTAIMALKCNATVWEHKYPQAAKAVFESFYVDDADFLEQKQSHKQDSSKDNFKTFF